MKKYISQSTYKPAAIIVILCLSVFAYSFLSFSTHLEVKESAIQSQGFSLTVMYRKSGESALSFPKVNNGDTLHYYKRGMNPYFRVYSIHLPGIQELEVTSFLEAREIKRTVLKSSGKSGQFADTYVEPREDLVRLSFNYIPSTSKSEQTFIFYILPDIKLY